MLIGAEPRPGDRLELLLLTARDRPIRKTLNVTRAEVMQAARRFRNTVTARFRPDAYRSPAQQFYRWLLAPLEPDLQRLQIGTLAYVLDGGLRSLPLSALHDGENFVLERYSIGLLPTLSLIDTRPVLLRNERVLAMGASNFRDAPPLPAVPAELKIISQLRAANVSLESDFTLDKLQRAGTTQTYGIVHLTTHGDFRPGQPSSSYLYLGDGRLSLEGLQALNLRQSSIDLFALSACRTAFGDRQAELGFAGLALAAGARTAVGSLWSVSDEGTLGLMARFYEVLAAAPLKAEALRQAQLSLLPGEVSLTEGALVTPQGRYPLPPDLVELGDRDLRHPYYWSAFTTIGNPW